jgi:XTP/dITP diphosphohydrolase
VIVYCASTNPGKLSEFRMAASDAFAIEPLPAISGIPACQETGSTFEENAIEKALYYGQYTDGLLFAEDSGLEVDALGGEPGVFSARYAGPNATDDANNRLVLEKMGAAIDRAARFVCVIALVRAGSVLRTFRSVVEGEVLLEPRGSNGFGYDPLFYYPPFGCGFGEVAREQKQAVSHRGAALRQLTEFLRNTR